MSLYPVEAKVWGKTQCLELNNVSSIHKLFVKSGFCCSIHKHNHRHNGFFVIEGAIIVRWWEPRNIAGVDVDIDGDRWTDPDEHVIENFRMVLAGNYFMVPAGLWHRFEVVRSGEVLENYWAELGTKYDVNDIERKNEGGPIESAHSYPG